MEPIESVDRRSIREWLLTGPIQVESGPEWGGVTGWLDATNLPQFVYTEMAGYYLTGLAFIDAEHPSGCRQAHERARRTLAWLDRECHRESSLPSTRRYLSPNGHDWRTRLHFAFDVAMAVRGMSFLPRLVPDHDGSAVQSRLLGALECFCGPGNELRPVVAPDGEAVPVRWSTLPGPYQLKIAAALLTLPGRPLSSRLAAACVAIRDRLCRGDLPHTLGTEWHADLYYLEGLMLLARHDGDKQLWTRARSCFARLVERWNLTGCSLTNSPGSDRVVRSDVIAQLLRAACILAAQEAAWKRELEDVAGRLAANLRPFVQPDGSVLFSHAGARVRCHRNVWCTLFAYQALTYFETLRDSSVDLMESELLI